MVRITFNDGKEVGYEAVERFEDSILIVTSDSTDHYISLNDIKSVKKQAKDITLGEGDKLGFLFAISQTTNKVIALVPNTNYNVEYKLCDYIDVTKLYKEN